jgi:hypothetical protein
MKNLIAEIKNKLYANEPVEKDEIYEIIGLFTGETIKRIEKLHKQTGLEHQQLITIAIKTMSEEWGNE